MSATWKAKKGPTAPGAQSCTVRLLDGSDILLDITKKADGQALFEQIIRRLEITQKEYFGLEFEDDHKIPQWLDLTKPLKKQIKRTPYRVTFKVRYYPLDPMVSRPSSRTHFYQQVRRDIIDGVLRCPNQLAPSLLSYVLQADLGDYESMDADIEYMCDEKLVSNEDITLQEEISHSHKLLRGTNPQQSVSGFLRKARDMDNYGTAFHDVKYKDGHCRVGISPNGLSLYQRSRRLEYYDWMKMVEVSFKGKKLTVIVKDEKDLEKLLVLEKDSSKATKELWNICVVNAGFYSTPNHRGKEEPEAPDLRSPMVIPPTVDMFGYPIDSLDESHGAKLKKSQSLPRKLPSDDPVLIAAMSHRGLAKQPDHYEDTDSPDLRKEPQTVDNMQLFLPDMPHILNQDDATSVPHRLATSHEHTRGIPNHYEDKSPHALQQDSLGSRSHEPQQDGNSRREGLKSGSSSRLSKSSHSSNFSQDDDMDGSLLDLADELGDEKEELVSMAPEGRETDRGIVEEPYPTSSLQKSPAVLNSQTLPRSFHSPEHTPPIMDHHHHRSPYKDDHTHSPKHKPGVSPYKEEEAPRHSPAEQHKIGSSQTTGRGEHKKKDGKKLVRQWVQEQRLRSFQPSHSSQDSTSSSSIGGNLEHFQPSPELRVLHATPPSPLTSQGPSQPSQLMQGPPKPPRNYYPESSELYDHISSHSKTLPSPKKDRRAPNTSPNRNNAFQKPESPLLQYKSSEAIYPTQSRESNIVTSNYKQSDITTDPIREVDDLLNELTANNEHFVHPRHTSGSKLEHPSHGDEPNSELERFRRASDSKVEQARHNRRASERKLLNSQKAVNQLLSENRESDIGVFSHDIEPRKKHVQIAEHESQVINDNSPSLVDNWFDKNVESPEPQVQEGTENLSGWTDTPRVTSPTDFKTIMDEVRESEMVPRPPAHLVALSQDMEAEWSDLRSPSPSGFTSPPLLPPSSVSSYSSPFHASVEHLQKIDLNVTDKTEMNNFRPSSATATLPPVIASFLSRVRQSSTEPADSSDGAISPPLDETSERKASVNQASTLKQQSNSTEGRQNSRPLSPLVAIPPTYDSPRLVRMQMSPTIKVSPHTFDEEESSKNNTLKSTDITHRQWIDDDNHLETKKSIKTPSFVSSANAHPSTNGTASTNYYSSDASVTITTSSSDAVVYDTPKAAHKQYQTSLVYPEVVTREPNKRSSFIENDKSTGLLKYAQRNADPLQEQKQFAHTWNTNYFDEPETKQVGYSSSQQRRSTEPTVSLGSTPTAYHPPPSPSTPLTPMSQHTHSDLAPNTFTYPTRVNLPPSQNHEVIKSTRFQQPPPFTNSGTTQGQNTRPETGQLKSYNQANPRSRNYRPPSQGGHVGGDVRRTQTFSTGRDSGWSNRYPHEEQRPTISPISDDSLPNSPTYFITNNPNDDRDTPSPATQAQNASFQEHLKELEVKGSRKLRVLDWMKQSSTNSQTKRNQEKAPPMKKDTNMTVPTKPYQKQAPVYASIDDLDENAHTQEPRSSSRPGSGRPTGVQRSGSIPVSGNKQPDSTRQREIETQQEFERQRIKLSSHSATGYDMEQRHRGSVPSRPYSRQAADQRRVEMERRATVADTRPASQVQRRANTFSYPSSQFQPPVAQGRGGDPRSTNRATPISSTGPTNNPGYPTTKYSGKDYYVIDV